jgi:hypothetical protein
MDDYENMICKNVQKYESVMERYLRVGNEKCQDPKMMTLEGIKRFHDYTTN